MSIMFLYSLVCGSHTLQLYSSFGLTNASLALDLMSVFETVRLCLKIPRDSFPFEMMLS